METKVMQPLVKFRGHKYFIFSLENKGKTTKE
jgi:hypothetical protein